MFVFSPPSKLLAICVALFCLFLNFQVLAQCDNYMGTLADRDTIYLCGGASFFLQVDSVHLMDNQQLFYVLHTQKKSLERDSIIAYNTFGVFQNDQESSNEIFATAVIAEKSDSIPINFNDPCLVLSNTVSITSLTSVKIESWENCRSFKGFSFSISGGLPEFDEESIYDVSGSHFTGKVKANDTITIEMGDYNYLDQTNAYWHKYEIHASDETGCSSSYYDEFRCYHLPVMFDISFEGEKTQAGILLKWKSRHQSYMDFFKIEVTKNGIDWLILDTIKAKGTPSEIIDYEYLDENFCDEICYYRLLATDVDGTTTYVGIIEIAPANYILVYPTPAHNLLNVEYNSEAPVRLSIFDTSGRIIVSDIKENSLNYHQNQIDISNLPNNMYFLVLSSEDFRETKKFVVQR